MSALDSDDDDILPAGLDEVAAATSAQADRYSLRSKGSIRSQRSVRSQQLYNQQSSQSQRDLMEQYRATQGTTPISPSAGSRPRGFSYIMLNETDEWSPDRLDDGLIDPSQERMRPDERPWGWSQLFLAIASITVLGVVLISNVVAKLALGVMFNELRLLMAEPADDTRLIKRDMFFVMLIGVILVPQCWTFCINTFRSFYTSAKHSPSPPWKVVPYILLQALSESAGLCIFVLYVAPRLEPLQAIFFMNGVFCFPTLKRLRKALGLSKPPSKRQNGRIYRRAEVNGMAYNLPPDAEPPFGPLERLSFLGGHLVQLACLVAVPYELYQTGTPLAVCILLPISQLLISVSWLPKLQERMIYVEDGHSSRCKTAALASGVRISFTVVCAIVIFLITGDMKNHSLHHWPDYIRQSPVFQSFVINIVAAFIGYNFAGLGCSMSIQRVGYALPLALSTPLTLLLTLLACNDLPFSFDRSCMGSSHLAILIAFTLALWISALAISRRTMWNSKAPSVAMDEALFIQPTYNAVFLEQHTILNRRPPDYGDAPVLSTEEYLNKSSIFICSTMYNEDEEEMKTLIRSILDIDRNLFGSCHIESHIFMDGATQGHRLEKTALRLIKAVRTLLLAERNEREKHRPGHEIRIEDFDKELENRVIKIATPYGMRIEFPLPCGMPFLLHLKDPTKVKSKKRWSQVMYMYYLLQFRRPKMHDREIDTSTYILTTDADVSFTTRDVKTLFALLSRDKSVGAVCGRTLPLGEGPLYWYQMFDYAIGHWFQKTAEHVLGTVLCCPGCFSMYRFEALRHVLREYSSDVEKAEEFLTKDMGEDRWLCTLLVLNEWRLEYTAAAYNETHVPEDFNEFWNQRRRWIVSTVANILELIRNWNVARRNDSISHMFMLYQFFMLVSSVLSPATVILVVIGGLNYATGLSISLISGFVISAALFFWILCLFSAQNTQLAVAKFLTLLFALVMAAVAVGIAAEIGSELASGDSGNNNNNNNHDNPSSPTAAPTPPTNTTTAPKMFEAVLELASKESATIGRHGMSVSTIYLGALIAMFLIAGLFHIDEVKALLAGFVYLLCLPGGYLFLIIYSFANLNDRSWGTRVDASTKIKVQGTWIDELFRGCGRYPTESFYHFMGRALCCRASEPEPQPPQAQPFTLVVDSQFSKNDRTWRVADDNEHLECSPVIDLVQRLENLISTGLSKESMAELKKSFMAAERAWPDVANGDKWETLERRTETEGQRVWVDLVQRVREKMEHKVIDRKSKPLHPVLRDTETSAAFLMSLGINDDHVHRLFENAGYDDTTFLVGLTQDDLIAIGIDSLQDGRRLCASILKGCIKVTKHGIPDVVPKELKQWLELLHLEYYFHNFQAFGYTSDDLELLRGLNESDAVRMGIRKRAHKKKFLNGLNKLTSLMGQGAAPEDTPEEIKAEELAREFVHNVPERGFDSSLVAQGNTDDAKKEVDFWNALVHQKIGKSLEKTGKITELRDNLARYRNTAVLVIFLLNAFWVVLMLILQTKQAGNLQVIGTNPLGLLFLVLYGGIFVIQFLALVWHRMGTLVQALSQVPFPIWSTAPAKRTRDSMYNARPLSIIPQVVTADE